VDLDRFNKKQLKDFVDILNSNPDAILQYCNSSTIGSQLKSYLQRRLIHFMNRQMQITLDGISPNGDTNTVSING
jgi:hypothetical protein